METSIKHAPADSGQLVFIYDFEPQLGDFRADALAGLAAPQKRISPKYLYDARGSALFDQITQLPEYYPTRTELGLLRQAALEIAEIMGPGAAVIELGSGSSVKVRLLIDALDQPALYVAQDISKDHLIAAAEHIAQDYGAMDVGAVCSDFTKPMSWPDNTFDGVGRRLVFFPGSTLGNFDPPVAGEIWSVVRSLLRPGDVFLLGCDLVKQPDIMVRAYDDAARVTGTFVLNLLHRLRAELDADLKLENFRYRADWNPDLERIEMRIESVCDQTFHVAGQPFSMIAGETIQASDSHKFTIDGILEQAERHGFTPLQRWVDTRHPFGVFLLEAV